MTEWLRFKMSNVHLKQGCGTKTMIGISYPKQMHINSHVLPIYLLFSLPGIFGTAHAQGFGEPEAS